MGRPLALRRNRFLAASPHDVYRAWLDPRTARRFLAPGTTECRRVEIDERVGGRYRVWLVGADGRAIGGSEGAIRELVPDRRIFLWWHHVGPSRELEQAPLLYHQGPGIEPDPDPRPLIGTVLTIGLEPTPDGGTKLRLIHNWLDGLAHTHWRFAHQLGLDWESVLDQLTDTLEPRP